METYRDVEAAFYGIDGNPPTRQTLETSGRSRPVSEVRAMIDGLRSVRDWSRGPETPSEPGITVSRYLERSGFTANELIAISKSELPIPTLSRLKTTDWVDPLHLQAIGLQTVRRSALAVDGSWQLGRDSINQVLGSHRIRPSDAARRLHAVRAPLRNARQCKTEEALGSALQEVLRQIDAQRLRTAVIVDLAASELNPTRIAADLRPGAGRTERAYKISALARVVLYSREVAHDLHYILG